MSKIKRIVGALLLTALILADGAQLFGSPPGVDGADQFDQAGLFPLKAYWMNKDYNSEGVFTGCSGKGTNCLVFALAFGGADMSVSSEGVHMQ